MLLTDVRGTNRVNETAIGELQSIINLPFIRGTWYYVDPQSGDNNSNGKTQATAVADIQTAYGKCTTGAGDGIILLSSGTTTANTTSYLTEALDWTKNAITVYGVAAPTRMFGRARIANDGTDGLDLAYLIDVQGDNNTFINVEMWNSGTDAAAIGCLKVSGNRNAFINCHATGGIAAGAGATHRNLELNACEEVTFYGCTFGTDTLDRGNNASGDVLITGAVYRCRFYGCEFLSYVSTGTAHGGIKTASTSLGRDIVFRDCDFICFDTQQASVLVGTAPTAGFIYITGTSAACNYAAWDSNGSNNVMYIGVPTYAASGGGGIPTTI